MQFYSNQNRVNFSNNEKPSKFLVDLNNQNVDFVNDKNSNFDRYFRDENFIDNLVRKISAWLRNRSNSKVFNNSPKVDDINPYYKNLLVYKIFKYIFKFFYIAGSLPVRGIQKILPVFVGEKKTVISGDGDVFNIKIDAKPSFLKVEKPKKFKTTDLIPSLRFYKVKNAVSFGLILLIFVLPLKTFSYYQDLSEKKGRVLGEAESAIDSIIEGARFASDFDFGSAQDNFISAGEKFANAKNEIENIQTLLNALGNFPNKNLKLALIADDLMYAGEIGASIGEKITRLFRVLSATETENLSIVFKEVDKALIEISSLSDRLNFIISNLEIDGLEANYKDKMSRVVIKVEELNKLVLDIKDFSRLLQIFFGYEYDKSYLLVFQNNTELRATGGFIGSYALVEFKNGEIKNLEIPEGGSYDTEGGFSKRITSPEPLHLVNALWYFWDANWWPDWPTTAEKLEWFYEKSGGPTVDGVLSFTPTVMEDVLEFLGPIDMTEDYGVTIDSENFWIITQTFAERKPGEYVLPCATSTEKTVRAVEIGDDNILCVEFRGITTTTATSTDVSMMATTTEESVFKENNPKRIIKDLFGKVLEKLKESKNKETFLSLSKVFNNSFEEKQILAYFKDEELESKLTEFGWDNKIVKTNYDYLMVVNSNIAGGKSDKTVMEHIDILSEVNEDGYIVNTLTINKNHLSERGAPYTGVRNVTWLRVYVPMGSKLVSTKGFLKPDDVYFDAEDEFSEADSLISMVEDNQIINLENGTRIYNEFSKTVFANWVMVEPEYDVDIVIKYKLPFKIDTFNRSIEAGGEIRNYSPYSFYLQKQPGTVNTTFNMSLVLPERFEIDWILNKDVKTDNGWIQNGILLTDVYNSLIIINSK